MYLQHVTQIPSGVGDDGVNGLAPQEYWGTAALVGTAEPFLSAAIGSRYTRSSAGVVATWIKTVNNGATADWEAVPSGTALVSKTELDYLDGATAGTGVASKAVVLDANNDFIWPAGQLTFQTAHSGLLFGSGASGANHSLGATADNAIEFYLNATHTTGDMRGEYLRLYFSGAGGSGEALRAFATINNVSVATGGTVNGAHISIGTAGASAAVSGSANALRATFGIAAASTAVGGTCAVLKLDTDFDTAITVPTNFAFIDISNTGVKKSNALLRIPNVVAETAGLFCIHTTQAMSHSIRIISANGTAYYVMCTDTATNRTVS